MDEPHLLAAVRYIETNPVRAGLVERPEDWPWSSAAAHLAGADDGLVRVAPMLELIGTFVADWQSYLAQETPEQTISRLRLHDRTGRPLGSEEFLDTLESLLISRLRLHDRTGRPLGSEEFLDTLESLLGRDLKPGKPGRPPKGGN